MFPDVATGLSREAYFEAGFEVLSDLGYGGLKLAEVCGRLGVTSGSFYHYFSNWSAYTHELVNHWKRASTTELLDCRRHVPDPRRRIDQLIHNGLNLPHGAEAAIRTWSNLDPDVHAAQAGESTGHATTSCASRRSRSWATNVKPGCSPTGLSIFWSATSNAPCPRTRSLCSGSPASCSTLSTPAGSPPFPE